MTYLREQGIQVPKDIAVVGFDNLDISPWFDPPLTTVDHVIPKIFREAVATLIQQIQSPPSEDPVKEWILPEIIIRKTS
jgi:LacI family purine nucleotide synthesis repressor